jgi:hypothetical protein
MHLQDASSGIAPPQLVAAAVENGDPVTADKHLASLNASEIYISDQNAC